MVAGYVNFVFLLTALHAEKAASIPRADDEVKGPGPDNVFFLAKKSSMIKMESNRAENMHICTKLRRY